jgi:hypothetical protein
LFIGVVDKQRFGDLDRQIELVKPIQISLHHVRRVVDWARDRAMGLNADALDRYAIR